MSPLRSYDSSLWMVRFERGLWPPHGMGEVSKGAAEAPSDRTLARWGGGVQDEVPLAPRQPRPKGVGHVTLRPAAPTPIGKEDAVHGDHAQRQLQHDRASRDPQ